MSQQTETLRRRAIRRALGQHAEQMLQDVAEGMQQFGTNLNAERARINGLTKTVERIVAAQAFEIGERAAIGQATHAFLHRSFLARLRWLVLGR